MDAGDDEDDDAEEESDVEPELALVEDDPVVDVLPEDSEEEPEARLSVR